jgi:molecular chaperone DnaK
MSILGIDLGTTNSVVAWMCEGRPRVIPGDMGDLTPSIVHVDRDGRVTVGEPARRLAVLDPQGGVSSSKRKMGTPHVYLLHGRRYTPVDIAGFILANLLRAATVRTGRSFSQAVIAVPAYFGEPARRATIEAAARAGVSVRRLVNEPTAATLAYGQGRRGERVMVWDLGGGTFDVSLLEFADGIFEVMATAGDADLGGDDWRDRLARELERRRDAYWGPAPDAQSLERLAETTKRKLSSRPRTALMLPAPGTADTPARRRIAVSREEFERWTRPLCERVLMPARQVLADAGVTLAQIDRVVLVGGATRMPMVRRLVAAFTGKTPSYAIDPDRAVALGTAVYAGMLEGSVRDSLLVDVVPMSLGIETEGGLCARLIERNTRLPATRDRLFTTARDNQTEVEIHVLQGEAEMASRNLSLGRFTLSGLPSAPKGALRISVSFSIDVDGLLEVQAHDLHTEQHMRWVVRRATVSADDRAES